MMHHVVLTDQDLVTLERALRVALEAVEIGVVTTRGDADKASVLRDIISVHDKIAVQLIEERRLAR